MASWCAVVPVKRLDRAKSRLHLDEAGLSDSRRPDLALAFACDTVSAALVSCDHVVVITDDTRAGQVLADLGAVVIADDPDAGINPALMHGFAFVQSHWPSSGTVAISADLACLQGDDLRHACAAADAFAAPCFVSDSAGTGSTAFFSPAGTTFEPAFGHRSRAQHRAAGIQEITGPRLTTLHRDIDTAADLWDAQRIGLGRHSLAVISTSTQQ